MSDLDDAKEIWKEALEAPLGIRVQTDDVQRLVQVLYEVKRTSTDPLLLQFTISQRGGCVLIARTKPKIQTDGEYKPLEL